MWSQIKLLMSLSEYEFVPRSSWRLLLTDYCYKLMRKLAGIASFVNGRSNELTGLSS